MKALILTLSTLSAVQAVESTPDSSQGQTERSSGKRVAESDVMQIINESLGGPPELKRLHRPSRQKILTGQKGCKLNMREVNNIEVIRDRINNYVKARPNLNKIELDLSENRLNDEEFERLCKILPEMKHLQKLDVSENNIGDEEVIALASELPKSLRALYLSGNNITAEGLLELIKRLKEQKINLQALDLSENDIGYEGVIALVNALPESVKILDVSRNRIGDLGAIVLANNLPEGLQELYLGGNHIGNTGAIALALGLGLVNEHLKSVKILDLSRNHIGNTGAIALANSFSKMTDFQELNVAYNDITAEGFLRLFTQLEAQEIKLKKLNISGNRLINSSLDEIRKALNSMHDMLRHLQSSVEELDIHGIDWGMNAPYVLSALKYSTSLKKLDVSYCGITGNNMKKLFEVLEPTGIEDLNICHNPFNNLDGENFRRFCAYLSGMTKLKKLNVSHCHLSTKELTEIVQKLPPSMREIHINNNKLRQDCYQRPVSRRIYDRFPEGVKRIFCRGLMYNCTRANAEILTRALSEMDNLKTVYAGNVSGESILDNDFNDDFKKTLSKELPGVEVK